MLPPWRPHVYVVLLSQCFADPSRLRPVEPRRGAWPPVRQSLDDPTALAIFEALITYDIETGGVAAKKAANSDVRELGKSFEADHRGLLKQTEDLGEKLNITPTQPTEAPLGQAHADAIRKLNATTGEEFDGVFLANEVAYHEGANRRVREPAAMFKTLVEADTGRVLGAHLLGPQAEEVINLFALATRYGLTAAALTHMVYAYPSSAADIAYMVWLGAARERGAVTPLWHASEPRQHSLSVCNR